jgi:Holliday junction DNA helicase RuvB
MPNLNQHQDTIDRALRPLNFKEFLGQEEAKANLQVYVCSARNRREPLDHVLLAGPAGLGKTTLAGILANEMGTRLVVVNAPALKTKGELAALLTSLRRNDILFIDEIHSLNSKIEEVLYPAMEDYKLEMVAGNRAITIPLEPFTLIGATTRAGMLQRPLRDRFGIKVEMQPYSTDELSQIIASSARKLGMDCSMQGANELAGRSHGTPRIAISLLKRVRDFTNVANTNTVDAAIVQFTCSRLGIDKLGLDKTAQKYLQILADKRAPIAQKTLAALLGESLDVVEEVIEPILLRLQFIEITAKGRMLTNVGANHIALVN